eukprot:547203-Pleurochrysis_carterae.AAC.2
MRHYGSCPPLSSKSKHAPGLWYSARKEALKRYSIETFCLKAMSAQAQDLSDQCQPEPKSYRKFRPRPDHSNYAECDECKKRRMAVKKFISESAPREEINAKRSEQMQHVQKDDGGARADR